MWTKDINPDDQKFAFNRESWRLHEFGEYGGHESARYFMEAIWLKRTPQKLIASFGTMIVPFSDHYIGDRQNPRPINERTYDDFINFGKNIAAAHISKTLTETGIRNWSNKTYALIELDETSIANVQDTLDWMLANQDEVPDMTDGWYSFRANGPAYYRTR